MQNHLFTYCFLGGLLLALSFPASGQRAVEDGGFPGYSSFLSPEKVYLHTDREVYNIGDTIWFRGYLENVSDLAEYPACNYLYVELFSSKWEINRRLNTFRETSRLRNRVKVKRDKDGHFNGYLPLTEDLNTGLATLRAYSYWMLNGDPAYMFSKNVELRNPMKDSFLSVRNLWHRKLPDGERFYFSEETLPLQNSQAFGRSVRSRVQTYLLSP